MFTLRTRLSDNIERRQKRQFANITAQGSDIPLKGEEWLERWCSLPMLENSFRQLYEFEVKNDDVYVVTFPKCGTTWIQEATWLLINNLDFKRANQEDLPIRSVFMDLSALYAGMAKNTIDMANKATSPRVLKTHLPAHLIPSQIWKRKCKIVYCTRNPKDMVVSYYHFHSGLGTWQGHLNEFVEDLINNDIMYTPYWEHVMDFWRMRQENNIFFTTYEDMNRDLRTVLIDLNRFLEKPQLSEPQLRQLEAHLSFDNMKANEHLNPTFNIKSGHGSYRVQEDFEFMRRGIVGTYKDELSAKDQRKLDCWIDQHLNKFNIKLTDIFGNI